MAEEYRMVDVDSHVLEPEDMWEKYLEPEFRDELPRHWCGYAGDPLAFEFGVVIPSAQSNAQYVMPRSSRKPLGEKRPGVFPQHELTDAYDLVAKDNFPARAYQEMLPTKGIAYSVLFPTVCLYTTAVPELSAATAAAYRRAYNNFLADFCKEGGSRLIGATSIDFRDPTEAGNEVRRCTKDFGFRGVYNNPAQVGEPLYRDAYTPLWNAMEEMDVPLAFHGGVGNATDWLTLKFTPDIAAGGGAIAFGAHYMLQCAALILGGVLDRHPNLRVGFMESGVGWAPYWLDRIESGNQGGSRGKSVAGLSLSPSEYFMRQCYVAAEQDDPGVEFFYKTFGDDNLCLSVDFGHPEGRKYSTAVSDWVQHPGLPMESKSKTMWDNGLKFYSIQAAD